MRRLCKSCESFVTIDGKTMCKYLNVERSDRDNPPPESMCWVKRHKPTEAEISAMRSMNGKKGGRPKGSGKGRAPCKQMSMWMMDYLVLSGYSRIKGITMVRALHNVCKSILSKYPDLKPENWID